MEDHKLRVFCTVAETKSFSKASEIIHLTQPAVSLQIQALEELHETKLFDRSSNSISLTPAGEILYRYAKEILSLYAAAANDIGELTGLAKGNLNLGASTTIGNYILPSVITDFRKRYPKIKVHLQVGNTKRVLDLLNSGGVDVGLVEGEVTKQKMRVERLVEDELMVIVSALHPWSKRNDVSIFDLTKEPFIVREDGSGTLQIIKKYLNKYNMSFHDLKVAMMLGSTEAIKNAVQGGVSISIVSQWAAKKEVNCGSLKLLNIKEERMVRDFSLIFHKHPISSHPAEEFLTYLKSYPLENLLK